MSRLYGGDNAKLSHEVLVGGGDDLAVLKAEATRVVLCVCDAGAKCRGKLCSRGDVVGSGAGTGQDGVEGGESGTGSAIANCVNVDLVGGCVPLVLLARVKREGERGRTSLTTSMRASSSISMVPRTSGLSV